MGEDKDKDVQGRCRRSRRLMARVGRHRRRDEGDGGRETEGDSDGALPVVT